MNQILSVENKKKGKSNTNKADIKNIIRFFCIFLIIMGLGIIGKSSYAIFQNKVQNVGEQNLKPVVDISREGDNINIAISHSKEIVKVIYQWNQEEQVLLNGNGTTQLDATIALPIGNNTLHLTVIDIAGEETSYERNYVTDAKEPQIKIELDKENPNKIIVTAKDLVAISFLTYRWDDEQEVRIEPNEDSKAQMQVEIAAPKGLHTLTVNVVNTNNITKTQEQQVKGVAEPKISIEPDPSNPKFLIMTLTDEEAVKGAVFTVNGKENTMDFSTVRQKEIKWWIEVEQGETRITVKAFNFDDITTNYDGTYTYNP